MIRNWVRVSIIYFDSILVTVQNALRHGQAAVKIPVLSPRIFR
jgi:hypothetical protein